METILSIYQLTGTPRAECCSKQLSQQRELGLEYRTQAPIYHFPYLFYLSVLIEYETREQREVSELSATQSASSGIKGHDRGGTGFPHWALNLQTFGGKDHALHQNQRRLSCRGQDFRHVS